MKSRNLTLITAMTLFAALAIPVRLAAQEHEKKHHRYKLEHIGTFGGPGSTVLEFAKIVNHKGIAAGGANTPTPDPACLNLLDAPANNCFVQHAFRYHNGVLTDLGTLPGANPDTNFSFAQWINEHGLIGGASENGLIDPNVGTPQFHAAVWKEDGEIIDLGTLGGYESQVVSMNDRGQAVGFSQNLIPDPFTLDPRFGTQTRAFLWRKGAMQDLGTLGGPDAFAVWVNDKSQVIGFSYTSSTPNPGTGVPTIDPFLWENGQIVDLGSLGGTLGFPSVVNSRRQVAGQSNLAGDIVTDPFLWEAGVMTDLGTLGGTFGVAQSLNDAGEAVGFSRTAGDQTADAFSWKNGVMTDLGVVAGDVGSIAFSINSRGQIVGTSFDSAGESCQQGTHAFLYENGGPMIDLNTLVPPNSGLTLRTARYINDRGEIGGVGTTPGVSLCDVDTLGHAFLLIPCGDDTEEGCGDDGPAVSAVPQSNASAVADSRAAVTRPASAPSGLAAIQARLARWFRFPVRKAPGN